MLTQFFKSTTKETAAESLYRVIIERARVPVFYTDLGVPDTLDGRFEMICLHTFLVAHRLKHGCAKGMPLARTLLEVFIADMDANLREMGAGDLGVGRRVKSMASGFYGRISAYEAGLAGGEADLRAAVERNVFGTVTPAADQVAALTAYFQAEVAGLVLQSVADLAEGRLNFGALPATMKS